MTADEVAYYLQVSPHTLYHWRARKERLPYVKKSNGHVRYDRDDVERLRQIIRPDGYIPAKQAAYMLGLRKIGKPRGVRIIKTPMNEVLCHAEDVKAECARRGRGGHHA